MGRHFFAGCVTRVVGEAEDGNDSVSKRLRTALVLPFSVGVEGLVEAGGEEAGFEAGGAEDGLLGEGHAFEGEEFLGVDGVIGCDEVFAEVGDLIEVFEADYGESSGGEAVFAGVLGRAVFSFRSAWAGRTGGVGAIGGELFRGNGLRHGNSTLRFEDGMEGGLSPKLAASNDGKETGCFVEKLSSALLFYDGLLVSVTGAISENAISGPPAGISTGRRRPG
jgi:hypothetical protein